MKRILSVLTILAMLLAAPVLAEGTDTLADGDYQYVLQPDGTAKITAYTGSAQEIVIPDTVMGIADYACSADLGFGSREIREIRIPDSVEYISPLAFTWITYEELTVRCSEGSYAEKYISRHFPSINLIVD